MKLYPTNPRQITHKGYKLLSVSLEDFGDLGGIVHNMPTDEIIGGNQRTRVFDLIRHKELITITHTYDEPTKAGTLATGYIEWKGERYSYRQVDWDAKTCQQANIQANKLGGDWDFDELANSFEVPDLLAWGFDESELQLDWGDDEEKDEPGAQVDKAEALLEKWKVQEGDVWQAGEHFIICADCRESETWTRLLDAAGVGKVNGIFTSPPYAEQRKKQYGGVPVDEYVEWWDAVQSLARANLAEDGSFFVNIKPHCEKGQRVLYVFDLVLAMVRRWGWRFVDELYWKRQGTPGAYTNRFKNVIEGVYHFSLQEKFSFHSVNVLGEFKGDYKKLDYSEHPHRASASKSGFETGYGNEGFVRYGKEGALPGNMIEANQGATVKDSGAAQAATFPIQLPSFFIQAYSDPGDLWCDPFLGSGTTIAAAEKHGRRGVGVERLPRYVAVCLERLSDMGLECKLLG